MQIWADYLQKLEEGAGAKVLPFKNEAA